MKLVLAEKPSVAMSLSKVIGANQRGDGYMEGNGYLISWCMGHLVELSQPEAYDEKYAKWRYDDLPIHAPAEHLLRRFQIRGNLLHSAYHITLLHSIVHRMHWE